MVRGLPRFQNYLQVYCRDGGGDHGGVIVELLPNAYVVFAVLCDADCVQNALELTLARRDQKTLGRQDVVGEKSIRPRHGDGAARNQKKLIICWRRVQSESKTRTRSYLIWLKVNDLLIDST